MRKFMEQSGLKLEMYLLRPLLLAGSFVLVALLWTFLLQHVMAYPFVFLFLAAIMASAWFGGILAGFWAIVFSSVLFTFFFIHPYYSMAIAREDRTYEGAFIFSAVVATVVSVARRRSEDAIRAARDHLEERVKERTRELELSNLQIIESENQLRRLAEAIPQQIWRADAQGVLEFCNQDLLTYVGLSMKELQSRPFLSLVHSADVALLHEGWQTAQRSAVPFERRARVRGGDGVNRWFLIRVIPQSSASGEISCWYGLHIDMEEQYREQRELLEAQGALARWSRTMSMAEMAASIAHEIKQPLTAMTAQAQACRRWLQATPAQQEKAMRSAENLVRECSRASAVVDRVRSLFSARELVREAVDVNSVLRRVCELLRDVAERAAVRMELRLAEDLPLVQADAIQLQQLALNLALNGIEAMKGRGGELVYATQALADGRLQISIADSGPGIPEPIRAHLYDPFLTTKPQGTGVGLAICRSIVEAHDGRIWFESSAGGTVFHVQLG